MPEVLSSFSPAEVKSKETLARPAPVVFRESGRALITPFTLDSCVLSTLGRSGAADPGPTIIRKVRLLLPVSEPPWCAPVRSEQL